MTALTWVGLAIVAAVIGAEFVAWCRPAQRWLLRRAAAPLPPRYRDRYYEEWLAELEEVPDGPVTRSLWAFRLVLGRRELASALGALRHLPTVPLAFKRIFDVLIAGVLLVVLSPLFAAVALAIKLTSPGPIMFRQFRSGQNRQPFRMYKFRTMVADAEQQRAALTELNDVDGPIFKMRNDPRGTRVGEWLRQTSLNELPQLINVLRGEMSLVGPRPFSIDESDKITGSATTRYSVPPGMTGLWQVSGRNELNYEDLRHLDDDYVASWSFWRDLRILLRTPLSVLFHRGRR